MAWVKVGSIKGPQGEPGSDATVTVDPSLSADSENPVQNKVVKAALDGKLEVGDLMGTPVITKDGAPLNFGYFYDSDTVGTMPPRIYASMGTNGQGTSLLTLASGNLGVFAAARSTSTELQLNGVSNHLFRVYADSSATQVALDGKTVTSITDAIEESPAGTALVTDKAVKDYVDANAMPSVVPVSQGGTGVTTEDAVAQMVFSHAPEASPTQAGVVKTLSDEDFCAYMGIDYNPDDWS